MHDKDLYIVSDAGDDFWFFRKMDFVNTGTDTLSLAVELLYESIIYETPPADSTEEWAWSYCVTGHCNDHMKPFDQHNPILPQDTGWHDINLQHNYSVGQGTFALKHYDYKVPEQLRVIDTMYVTICWDLISQGGDHDHCTGEKLGPNISFINSPHYAAKTEAPTRDNTQASRQEAIKIEGQHRGGSPGQYRRAEAEEAGRGGWRRRLTEEGDRGGAEGGREEGAEG